MHGFSSYLNLYDVLWTTRILRNTLSGKYSLFIVDVQLLLLLRELEVLPLDFSIFSLPGKMYNDVIHSLALCNASGSHEYECAGILTV